MASLTRTQNIIFGTVIDDELGDEVKVTVIAAGFDRLGTSGANRRPTRRQGQRQAGRVAEGSLCRARGRSARRSRRRFRCALLPEVSVLDGLVERLQQVRQQIVDAGGSNVEILAVTKGHPIEVVQAAADAGLTAVGENYAQELVAKFDNNSFGLAVHFIGQLQTNKVRQIVDLVAVYETVDRPALVVELAKRAQGAHVLVQVNTNRRCCKGRLRAVAGSKRW